MNCFNHKERPAVGICKNCNRGLCVECAMDLGSGLGCEGKCQEIIAESFEMGEVVRKKYKNTYKLSSTIWQSNFLWAAMAIGFGLYTGISELRYFLFAFAAVWIIIGLRQYKQSH